MRPVFVSLVHSRSLPRSGTNVRPSDSVWACLEAQGAHFNIGARLRRPFFEPPA